jgi:hypothetical protein
MPGFTLIMPREFQNFEHVAADASSLVFKNIVKMNMDEDESTDHCFSRLCSLHSYLQIYSLTRTFQETYSLLVFFFYTHIICCLTCKNQEGVVATSEMKYSNLPYRGY